MSQEKIELSSDLEWMLLSGQVEAATLMNRLVHEEFANLYRLALSVLEEPEAARMAAREALSQAVLNTHQYNGREARIWLCAITREVCQARQRQPFHQSFSGFLRRFSPNGRKTSPAIDNKLQKNSHPPALPERTDEAVVEFSPNELDQIATDIHAIVKKRRQRLNRWTTVQQIALIAATGALVILAGMTLDERTPTPQPPTAEKRKAIVTEVVYVNPTQAATSTPTPFPERAVLYEVERAGTLEMISREVGVAAEILSSLNGMPPDQELAPGQKVMIGIGAPPLAMVTPTPVTPAPLPEALTSGSTFEEVFHRIQESRKNWHTLWADAVEMDYGPNGFASPPEVKRYQVWISQPAYDQVLIGDLNGKLSQAWRRVSEHVYALDFERGKRSLSSSYSGPLGFTAELGNMLYPERHRYPAEGKMTVLGVEQIAGRESLVLDWHYDDPNDQSDQTGYMGRYWVDTIIGVITRRQQFIRGNPELLLKDILIVDIAFDVNFSNALFDQTQPFPTKFASDYRGTPEPPEARLSIPSEAAVTSREPLLKITPPAEFDPAQNRLSFEWRDSGAYDRDQPTSVNLFAGDYYLAEVEFVHPNNRVMCDRSPDGQLLAYSEWLPGGEGTTPLRWLSLSNLEEVRRPLPNLGAYDFAFSPDSQRLAVVACENEVLRDCWLYVIDTKTMETEKIVDLYAGESLVWKPDGEHIALIGILKDGEEIRREVVVVEVESGEVVYRGQPFLWTYKPAAEAPIHEWGVAFPAWRLGLEKCEVAP